MVKAAFLKELKKFSKLTELHRYLINNPKDAEYLGFKKLPDRTIKLPTYETLRYFIGISLERRND